MLLSGINSYKINCINNNINFKGISNIYNFPGVAQEDTAMDILDLSYKPKGIKECLISDGLDETMAEIISKDEDTYEKYANVLKSMVSKNGRFMHQTSTEQGLKVLNIVNNHNIGKKSAKRIAALEALGINNAVFYATKPDIYNRMLYLITEDEDGRALLIDDEDEDTVLKRPLTIKEFNEITSPKLGNNIFNDGNLVKNYIEIIDSGLDIKSAARVASDEDAAERYMQLTSEDKFGQTTLKGADSDIILSRKLTPKEASLIVLEKEQEMSNKKVQYFIDLKDEGLEDFEAIKIASSNKNSIRYFELTTPEKDGSVILLNPNGASYIKLSRAFSPKEAAFGLNLENQNLKAYQDLIDSGVSMGEAYVLAKDIKRADAFFKLITPDDNGEVKLQNKNKQKIILPRALSVNEALIAISERQSLNEIYYQLTVNDAVKSRQHIE